MFLRRSFVHKPIVQKPNLLEAFVACFVLLVLLDTSDPVEWRDKAHAIIREAAENLHEILVESKDVPHPASEGVRLVQMLGRAMRELIILLQEASAAETARKLSVLREHQRVTARDADKTHRVLG